MTVVQIVLKFIDKVTMWLVVSHFVDLVTTGLAESPQGLQGGGVVTTGLAGSPQGP